MGLFDFLARSKPHADTQVAVPNVGFSLKMSTSETDIERQKNALMLEILESSIIKSGYFIPEKLPHLMATLRASTHPFARLDTKSVEDGALLLSVDEKKARGLNTRMKYTKDFISYFDPAALKKIEPKGTLFSMQIDAFHRASRHFEILRFKKMGFVEHVKIMPVGGCKKVQRIKKTYPIDEVPDLPLPGCDEECHCCLEAVIPSRFTS
jgi:hypothetical protein